MHRDTRVHAQHIASRTANGKLQRLRTELIPTDNRRKTASLLCSASASATALLLLCFSKTASATERPLQCARRKRLNGTESYKYKRSQPAHTRSTRTRVAVVVVRCQARRRVDERTNCSGRLCCVQQQRLAQHSRSACARSVCKTTVVAPSVVYCGVLHSYTLLLAL